jgi:WD40 repeat protein
LNSQPISDVVFSPDGKRLTAALANGTARVWDLADDKPKGIDLEHMAIVTALAFSPDGAMLATASLERTLQLWDVATGDLRSELSPVGPVYALAFSPDGKKLAAATDVGIVQFWDLTTAKLSNAELLHVRPIRALSFALDGSKLYTHDYDNIQRWEVATGKLLGDGIRIQDGFALYNTAFSPDGTKLAYSSQDKTVRFWNLASGQPTEHKLSQDEFPSVLAFSPDGTKLAVSSADKHLRAWDLATGKPLGPAIRASSYVALLAVTSNGKILAAAEQGKSVRVWDVATGKDLGAEYPVKQDSFGQLLSFTPDGKTLAAGSGKFVQLFDVPTALEEPAEHIELWVETLIGVTINDAGVVRTLPSDQLRQKEAAFRNAGGPPRVLRALADRQQVLNLAASTKRSRSAAAGGWWELSDRGHKHASAEQWKEAAADLTAAVRARPDDHWLWVIATELLVMSGDVEGYRKHCRDMLEQFGETKNPIIAERTAKACLLMPDGISDLTPVLRLSDLALDGTEKHGYYNYFLMANGLAKYRAGQFDRAIEQSKKCLTPEQPVIGWNGPAYLVLAMAHHRLGHADEAKQALDKAREIIDVDSWPKVGSGNLGDGWHDVLITHLLRQEAEQMISGTPTK